jgi:hypothetical protein
VAFAQRRYERQLDEFDEEIYAGRHYTDTTPSRHRSIGIRVPVTERGEHFCAGKAM